MQTSCKGQLLSSSFTRAKIHEQCNVVRRAFWYMTTWTLSNLFPWLRSLLCTFAVTGWQTVQLEITARTIRLWQASVAFVLECCCVKNGKKGEVEARSNFTPPQPVSYLHDTKLQLRYWCFVVAACWGWRRCWGEEEETWSLSILQKHALILWEFDLWYRQQKSVVEQPRLYGCSVFKTILVAIVAWHTNITVNVSKTCAFKR